MSLHTIALFCCLDDFAKVFEGCERHRLIPTGRKRLRSGKLSLGEMLFIMVLFHLSPFKDFKHFRIHGVEQKYRDYFGELPSYGRFGGADAAPVYPVLMPCRGGQTGLYIADSTKLAVCHNPRISRNRVFERPGRKRADLYGLVLRLQTALGGQPQGRNHGNQDHAGEYR